MRWWVFVKEGGELVVGGDGGWSAKFWDCLQRAAVAGEKSEWKKGVHCSNG
jgi:hypothetical protein